MDSGTAVTRAVSSTGGGMRLEALEAHGVPANILAIWRATVGPELLPVQASAVREHGLLSGRENLIVFSPTSSGKTFIGEMAAVRAAGGGTKVFYLVPQKALADEKFREFRGRYEPIGLDIVVSSSDHREYDERITRGDFHIAVVVFEKLHVLFVRKPQLIDEIGLVVIDELQLINDEDRGPALELLLTKLRLAESKPRLLGLSAVLGRADLLARWLGARLLVHEHRPVELRKGVLCRGEFRYREHNSGAEGVESFGDVRAERREDLLLPTAEELARRGEQVLVFAPDRKSTVKLAQALAARLGLPPLSAAIAELGEEEETQAQRALREVLGGSVAYHNSDLSADERRIIERHFRNGGIRVLVSTATLAVGMNLPTKNVVIDGRKWKFLKRYRRSSLVDVGKSEYENMSGRAGRLAFTSDFGRSILVTSSPFHADVWMRNYVAADFEPIQPRLMDAPLENHVLNLLTSGLAHTTAELEKLLHESFTAFVHWRQAMSREEFAKALRAAVDLCRDGGLVREDAGGRLTVTEVGEACARKGIDVQTGLTLLRWAMLAKERPVKSLEMLARLGETHAGQESYVPLSRDEKFEIDYRSLLFARMRLDEFVDRELFARIADTKMAIEYADAVAVKKALVLADWIAEMPTPEIEQAYRVSGGMIRRIGGDYAWLVEGLGEIAKASGWPQERCRVFDLLAERLVHGVKQDALPLARLRVPSLRRSHLRALVRAGLTDVEALRAAQPDLIESILQHDTAFASLAAQLGLRNEMPESARDVNAEVEPSPPADEPILLVDVHDRRVTFRAHAIPTRGLNNLQRQPFFALACLAEQPGTMVSMEHIAAYVHAKGRLRGVAVASEARDLRYRILRAFRRHLPPDWSEEIEELVEVVQGVGLRLNTRGPVRVIEPAPSNAGEDQPAVVKPRKPARTAPAKARRRASSMGGASALA